MLNYKKIVMFNNQKLKLNLSIRNNLAVYIACTVINKNNINKREISK